ncbi:MAG: hypothetical protein HXX11_14480 [Desulfuromonadales bacterium]|nr:hypothetical protein [Desulfuromonadales bacterium]
MTVKINLTGIKGITAKYKCEDFAFGPIKPFQVVGLRVLSTSSPPSLLDKDLHLKGILTGIKGIQGGNGKIKRGFFV